MENETDYLKIDPNAIALDTLQPLMVCIQNT